MVGSNATIINESLDGRTVCHDRFKRCGIMVVKQKLRTHYPLEYILIMLGTNDLKQKYGPPPTERIVQGMEKSLSIIRRFFPDLQPILLTPPPIGESALVSFVNGDQKIAEIANGYRSLCNNLSIKYIDIHAILDPSADLENDGIHLNERGRVKVAQEARKALRF
jgi:lysophospholipase L1-like esterase